MGWNSLGGDSIGEPAIVSWASDRLDVVVRDTHNNVLHKWREGRDWKPSGSGWESLGGDIADGPSAVTWDCGRLDLFARGTDNSVLHKWIDGRR
jgi:sialidase-1